MNDGVGIVSDGVSSNGWVGGRSGVDVDVPRGRRRARIVTAGVIVAVGAVVLMFVAAQRPWVFEATAGLGALVGLGLATGALDHLPRRGVAGTTDHADPALRAALWQRLASLDPLEHRRLELGDPWPSLVVGPTGVTVVAPASAAYAQVAARLRTVAGRVERQLAATDAAGLPVRTLLVVEGGGAVPDEVRPALGDGIRRVEVDAVLDVLGRGRLASLAAITTAHQRLSADLVDEPRAAS